RRVCGRWRERTRLLGSLYFGNQRRFTGSVRGSTRLRGNAALDSVSSLILRFVQGGIGCLQGLVHVRDCALYGADTDADGNRDGKRADHELVGGNTET